jgi:hypothetical protein
VPGKSQRLSVVVTRLTVFTNQPLNLTQPSQDQDFTGPVTEMPG